MRSLVGEYIDAALMLFKLAETRALQSLIFANAFRSAFVSVTVAEYGERWKAAKVSAKF